MISINKALIYGRLGSDPEIRHNKDGGKLAILSIATNSSYKDKTSGKYIEKSEWHEVVVYKPNVVQLIEGMVKKGDEVYVEGAITKSKWTDSKGVEKSQTQIQAKDPEHIFKFFRQRKVENNPEEKLPVAKKPAKKKAAA
jgi:single-strand DNA-binding protein